MYWSISWNVTDIDNVRKIIEAKELENYYIDLEISFIINDFRTFPNTYIYLKDSDVV